MSHIGERINKQEKNVFLLNVFKTKTIIFSQSYEVVSSGFNLLISYEDIGLKDRIKIFV